MKNRTGVPFWETGGRGSLAAREAGISKKNLQKFFSVALRARIGPERLDWPSSGLLLLATGNKFDNPAVGPSFSMGPQTAGKLPFSG